MGDNWQRDIYANAWTHGLHWRHTGIATWTHRETARKKHMATRKGWRGPHMEAYMCLWQRTPGTLQRCTFLHELPPISHNVLGKIWVGQIHYTTLTNTFSNFDKYMSELRRCWVKVINPSGLEGDFTQGSTNQSLLEISAAEKAEEQHICKKYHLT